MAAMLTVISMIVANDINRTRHMRGECRMRRSVII
jgi:hypothetical protein